MGKIQASGEIRMTRRSVLCGALVTVAVGTARTVLAQQMQTHLPPRVAAKPKGPLVFLDYDKTPEFQRQNRDFAAAVKAAGKRVTFLVGQGYNHFEMFETLGNPYGLLGRAVLEQMKLKTV